METPCTVEFSPKLLSSVQAYLTARMGNVVPRDLTAEAWELFQPACSSLLDRLAKGHGLKTADKFDCVQESWLQILVNLPRLDVGRGHGRFCSWLCSIVHGKAVDQLRFRARHSPMRLVSTIQRQVNSPEAPWISVSKAELRVQLQGLLGQMRPLTSEFNHRLFLERWVSERTIDEIAMDAGLSRRQIICRLNRLKKQFRQLAGEAAQCGRFNV